MKPILFLDIDGVLNSRKGWARDKPKTGKYLTAENVAELRALLEALPDLRIVISSTWRKCMDADELLAIFKAHGLPAERVIGMTPIRFSDRLRGHEIQEWLDANPGHDRFVILDDDSDMAHLMPHLVQTSFEDGLTREKAEEVIRRLKP